TLLLARDQLKKAVDLGARSAKVFDNLGSTLEHLGQLPAAIQAYSKALELEPKNLKVLVKRGWAYVNLTPPLTDKARQDFGRVVRLDPRHAEARAGLGSVQASRKPPAEARRQAALALLHGAGDYLVLHNIACVYARLAQTDVARAAEYEDQA